MEDGLPKRAVSPTGPPVGWQEQQRLKEELFERAKLGEVTGKQADAEAVRLGLGTLSQTPDAESFDPDVVPYWTLVMCVAWIASRSKDRVRAVWEPWRQEWREWVKKCWQDGHNGSVREGWFLEPWEGRATLALLAMDDILDGDTGDAKPLMSIADATGALWIALREGFFDATGLPIAGGLRTAIPALAWQELKAYEGYGHVDEVRLSPMGGGYRDVLVPSHAVLGHWREPKPTAISLPILVPPDGDGYMPLYCAAQWIATHGGSQTFDPEDQSVWRDAFNDLLAAISSDKVRVVGSSAGQREPVPGYVFAGCQVDYPFVSAELEVWSGGDLFLRSYPYVDEDHWRRGFYDSLMNRSQERWSYLMVAKADVRARWPFDLNTSRIDQTGMPGRPQKSRHLIDAELQRRAAAGQLADSLNKEADALYDWMIAEHADKPRPTAKVIRNNIRDEYRRLKGTK